MAGPTDAASDAAGSRAVQVWEIAAESFALSVGPRVRPRWWEWVWYAYFGRLPARNSVWVLYDTTCSTWVVRYLARAVFAVAIPVALVALFLPAGGEARAITAGVSAAGALLFLITWINETSEHRMIQAGYPWSLAAKLRAKRDEVSQWLRVW